MKLLYSFLLVAISWKALGQNATTPDFIIDFHGDTIYGIISKQTPKNYQRIVEFTKPVECESYVLDQLKFYPQDIQGYYKHKVGFFVSKTIKADNAVHFPEWQIGTVVFLKVIEQGYFNLLEYQSLDGTTKFFFDTPEQRKELIAITEKNYRAILDRYLRYCHHKQCNATYYRYQREKLIELFKRHNRYRQGEQGEYLCTPETPIFIDYGIRAGLQHTQLAHFQANALLQPYGGVHLHISQRKRWSFQPEFNLITQSFQAKEPTKNITKMRYNYLQFATVVQYEIAPISSIKPTILAGVSTNIVGSRSRIKYQNQEVYEPFSEQTIFVGTSGTVFSHAQITILYEVRFFYAKHFSKLVEMSQYGVQFGTSVRF
jgi:hypothetical protein